MKTTLLMLALVLLSGHAVGSEAQVNLVADPGFEKQPDAGRGAWVGTQNAGKPVFERSGERPHSGQIAAKVTCRTGDVYARWVYQAPDLFARDRVLVLCEGRPTAEFARSEATEEKIMHAALPRKAASLC